MSERVLVPYKQFFHWVWGDQAPPGRGGMVLNDDVQNWFDDNSMAAVFTLPATNRLFPLNIQITRASFYFADPNEALLFKLTWGGE